MNIMVSLYHRIRYALGFGEKVPEVVREGKDQARATINSVVRVQQRRNELRKVFPISGFLFPTEGERQ